MILECKFFTTNKGYPVRIPDEEEQWKSFLEQIKDHFHHVRKYVPDHEHKHGPYYRIRLKVEEAE